MRPAQRSAGATRLRLVSQVAVIVVTYNSADSIGQLLESLPAGLAGTDSRVVVVDNGSTDQTPDLVAARPEVRLVRQANLGYSAGINAGIGSLPQADAYIILNPDLVVRPGFAEPLVDALAGRVGIVVPKVLDDQGLIQRSLRREPTVWRALGLGRTGHPALSEYVLEDSAYERPGDFDWALGAAMAVSRECLDSVGDWDESFFLYSEETDFCLRARDRGWATRYLPDSVVVHSGGGSGRSDATHTMQIVNRVRLYARRNPGPRAWAYWALTILSELSWLGRGHPQSWASVKGLLLPSHRPAVLGCSDSILPR